MGDPFDIYGFELRRPGKMAYLSRTLGLKMHNKLMQTSDCGPLSVYAQGLAQDFEH